VSAPFPILLPPDQLAAFCRRWGIAELAVFGSALRPDFRAVGPDASDLDILVTYGPDARPSLMDEVRMQRELVAIAGRPVDLVSRRAIESSRNPNRKAEILSTARTLYAA
jgi:predicted nucleotidyltransferase